MKLYDYIDFIEKIPSKNHSFTIKKLNWQNHNHQFEIDNIFGKQQEITLNRNDLISAFHINTSDFILKTLMWGYPIKGRGNNIDNLLEKENFNELVKILDSYKIGTVQSQQLENDIKSINGLGLSTMSKFLCFMQVKVESETSVILDRRIIDILNKGIFEELHSIKSIRYPTSIKNYIEYLKAINVFSKKHQIDSEKVEMFIFIFGKHLSPLQGEECYDEIYEIDSEVQKTYQDFLIETINNLEHFEQNIFTDTLNLLMHGNLKEVNNVFEINDVYNFNINHLENSKDKNVETLVTLIKNIEKTIKSLKENNNINDNEINVE